MARTPSMSAETCEAILGLRGSLTVDEANKGVLRKWCTAKGLPGKYVWGLANKQLQGIYNVADDSRLAWHKSQAVILGQTQDEPENEEPVPAHIMVSASAPPTPKANDQITRISALLAELLAHPAIDAEQVNALIDQRWQELPDLIAKHSPVTRIEIKIGDTIKQIAGHIHKTFKTLLQLVSRNRPVMMVGPAGSGKSTAAEQVAEAIGLRYFLQPAATGAHEYLGHIGLDSKYHSTPYRECFEHGGVFVAEELDSGSAECPIVLNAGIANGHQIFPDSPFPIKRHPDFRLVANANTHGNGADRVYVGRVQLDGSTIDRLAIVDWEYDETLERVLAGNDAWVDRVQALRKAAALEHSLIIISPRASIGGADMIASCDWSFAKCEEHFIWKGRDAAECKRIKVRAVA